MVFVSFFNMLVDLRDLAVLQTGHVIDCNRFRNEF